MAVGLITPFVLRLLCAHWALRLIQKELDRLDINMQVYRLPESKAKGRGWNQIPIAFSVSVPEYPADMLSPRAVSTNIWGN